MHKLLPLIIALATFALPSSGQDITAKVFNPTDVYPPSYSPELAGKPVIYDFIKPLILHFQEPKNKVSVPLHARGLREGGEQAGNEEETKSHKARHLFLDIFSWSCLARIALRSCSSSLGFGTSEWAGVGFSSIGETVEISTCRNHPLSNGIWISV